MRTSCSLALLSFVALLGCGASTPKPGDASEATKTEEPSQPAEPSDGAKPAPEAAAPAAMGTVKRPDATDVPDDYSLTENDCQALGRQYGAAARADQLLGVSPKLAAKQREQVEASIDAAVSKLETQWTDTCLKSLAGKVVDHKHITCALAAKTVKAFDSCVNGDKAEKK